MTSGHRREYRLLETGDAHHDRGAQDDAPEDLHDDLRLAEQGERPVEQAEEDDDDSGLCDEGLHISSEPTTNSAEGQQRAYLDDEQEDGVRGVIFAGIGSL